MAQNIIDIYTKYLDGTINRVELDLLLQYFEEASEAELRLLMDHALMDGEYGAVTADTQASLQRVQLRLAEHTTTVVHPLRSKKIRPIIYAAAVAVLIIGMMVLYPYRQKEDFYAPDPVLSIRTTDGKVIDIHNQQDSIWNLAGLIIARVDSQTVRLSTSSDIPQRHTQQVISTDRSDFRIILEDGSVITLNAHSSLTLAAPFDERKREVSLSGEGYFQIKHDSIRPFVVHANHTFIEVLGTQFNVRNYPEEKQVETALIEGKIALSHTRGGQKIILSPGQKVFSTDRGIAPLETGVGETVAWRDRYFAYEDQPLSRVLLDICRWYGTTLDTQRVPKDKKIYMKIEKGLPLSEVLGLLKETSDLDYVIEDRKITIYKKETPDSQQNE